MKVFTTISGSCLGPTPMVVFQTQTMYIQISNRNNDKRKD